MTPADRTARRHWARVLATLTREDYWSTDATGGAGRVVAVRRIDDAARVLAATHGEETLLHALVTAAVAACFAAASGAETIVVGAAGVPVIVPVRPEGTARAHLAAARAALIEAHAARTGFDGRVETYAAWTIGPDAPGDGTVDVRADGDTVEVRVDADAARFREATVGHLADQIATLATGLVTCPDDRLVDLPRLPEAARVAAVRAATGAPRPGAPPLEDLLWSTPRTGGIALAGPGGTYTWAELRGAVDTAARALAAGTGTVALLTGQTTTTVVGALAALRAGRPYVVVPPGHHEDRAMLRARGVTESIGPGGLDSLAARAEATTAPLPERVDPDLPAYLVFTSGSTGAAKAIAVTRANLAESTAARIAVYGSDPGRFLLLSPLHFDSSVAGLYWTIACGGTLDIASDGIAADPGALAGHVRDHRVAATLGLPRVLDGLFRSAAPGDLASLRVAIGAGERFPAGLRAGPTRLFNEYGPSEATVWATWHLVTGDEAEVPIGQPVPGSTVYVLDTWGAPVPPGLTGELAVGGPQVAAGYLHASDADAARFGPLPGSGERVYRTGDVGWADPDGTLWFAGRRDDEVKIRGVRVALADVAAAFLDAPGVTEAEAVLDNGSLVVVVAPPVDAATALDAARPRLGRHAVPARLVGLPTIPRLPNGKLDRRALAGALRPEPPASGDEPADPLERRLVEVFRTALGHDALGPHDNFFTAGGDSIRAALVCAELSRWLHTYVYVVALLDHRTPAALAAFLRANYARELRQADIDAAAGEATGGAATEAAATALRATVTEHADPRGTPPPARPVPRLAFVLGPPRSGTTLLRVMLGGHPGLFAPPELELMQYGTLAARQEALSGRYAFYREGLTRAVMALAGLDPAGADAFVDGLAASGATTAEVYGWLVAHAGGRTVVDKTTTYALDPRALARAEQVAHEPRYVYLTRDPRATVESYLTARLDQMYLRARSGLAAATEAELVWRIAHEHLAAFLDGVEEARVLRLSYEELVTAPADAARRLCGLLGVDFDARMLDVHDDPGTRMTDAVRPGGRMLGDVRFSEHRGITTASRDRGRGRTLHPRTEAVARELGYTTEGRVGDTPLSAGQRWMWLLEFMNPGTTMFTVPLALAGRGRLDLDAVRRAMATLARRHHALRSLVVADDGDPVIRFAPDLVPPVLVEAVPAAGQAARAAELATAGFDLSGTGAARLHVLTDGEEFLLLFLVHHIVADAWSARLLTRDFLAAYHAWHRGRPPELEPLRRQAADAARDEAARDPGEVASLAKRVRERLDGAVFTLNLPPARADRAGAPGVHAELRCDPVVGRAVRRYAATHGTSLFPVLLAAYGLTLAGRTGDRDLCVGTPVLTRGPLDTDVVGMLVNTAVVRLRVDDEAGPVAGAVRAVRDAIADADLPFEELVMAMADAGAAAGGALLRAVFSVQDLDLPLESCPELRLRPVPLADPHTKFDVSLAVAPADDAFAIRVSLAGPRFDPPDAERFARDYADRLSALVDERGDR